MGARNCRSPDSFDLSRPILVFEIDAPAIFIRTRAYLLDNFKLLGEKNVGHGDRRGTSDTIFVEAKHTQAPQQEQIGDKH